MKASEAGKFGIEPMEGMTSCVWICWFDGAKDPTIRNHGMIRWERLSYAFTKVMDGSSGPRSDGTEQGKEAALSAKLKCPAFSMAVWKEGAKTRSTANVERMSGLVLDYDSGVSFAEAWEAWDGWERAAYTSWNHAEDAPRLRMVFPLGQSIPAHLWGGLYRRILEIDGKKADPKDCNVDRIFFGPAVGCGGPHQTASAPGARMGLLSLATRIEAQRVEAEEARRALNAQRVRELAQKASQGAEREKARMIDSDPALREAVGLASQGQVVQGSTPAIRRAQCPSCGGQTVWWAISGGNARCNHQNTCGWVGRVSEYAALLGVNNV